MWGARGVAECYLAASLRKREIQKCYGGYKGNRRRLAVRSRASRRLDRGDHRRNRTAQRKNWLRTYSLALPPQIPRASAEAAFPRIRGTRPFASHKRWLRIPWNSPCKRIRKWACLIKGRVTAKTTGFHYKCSRKTRCWKRHSCPGAGCAAGMHRL